jgi:hypothetical protein
VPAQNRVRRDDARDFPQHLPAYRLALHGQSQTLGIGEAQPLALQLLSQDAILSDEVLHHGDLLAVQPASHRENQELERQAGHGREAYRAKVPKPPGRRSTQAFEPVVNLLN